ncbi:glycosyltransferase family 4 protein [Methanonatronarchaeum sp. AMET6-2]|uniref:glycosyltransferase family 4 protein n=1 Tax=Methanonatronarchaeum sp. AMET6-2 TaxID=2933293 RepID=UPI001FF1D25B|nr:glycosyltransferase family 4 protein [Methanonatronarchaeum sp. AMET6-2]UOY10334.1 glycosyltransferase family 4 protein [Methanonatronarchaeum sp. AMET6-2]
MKIAYITDVIYPWTIGGAEKRTWELAKRLTQEHEIHIITMKWWEGPKTKTKQNVTLHGICKPIELYKNDRRSIKEALHFSTHLLKPKMDYDIIDINQFPYFPALTTYLKTKLKNTKTIITWHEVWDEYWLEYLGKPGHIGRIIEKITPHTPNHNVSVSKTTQQKLSKLGHQSTVIPNGIDLKQIQEIEPQPEGYDVLYVGRLIKEKNVDTLIKATENTNLTLGIIGTGPQQQKLQKLTQKTNKNTKMHGNTEYKTLIGYMKSSKTLALPSSREGFGITALEAMATGTPVITVNEKNNAAKHLVTQKTGITTDLNPNKIKKAIQKIIENPEKQRQMSLNAKKQAEKYDWNKIAKKTDKLYKKIKEKG